MTVNISHSPTNAPRIGPLLLITSSLIVGLLTGALFGTLELHAHTITYTPLMAATELLIVLAFGISLGTLLTRLLRSFRSRSKLLNRVSVLAATLVALYTAWIAWISNFIYVLSGHQPLARFFLPSRMSDIIIAMNRLGPWAFFGKPAYGPLLTLVWFAEIFAVITLTVRIAEWKSHKPTA